MSVRCCWQCLVATPQRLCQASLRVHAPAPTLPLGLFRSPFPAPLFLRQTPPAQRWHTHWEPRLAHVYAVQYVLYINSARRGPPVISPKLPES